jgi:hypothetical protein
MEYGIDKQEQAPAEAAFRHRLFSSVDCAFGTTVYNSGT